VQRFAVDVKGPFAKYPALTGGAVDEVAARRNLSRIFALPKHARTPSIFAPPRCPCSTMPTSKPCAACCPRLRPDPARLHPAKEASCPRRF
jgi:hypothetical protein